MALHALATNAAKYDALSVTTGQVRLDWRRTEHRQLVLRWTRAGGPFHHSPDGQRFCYYCSVMESMRRHEGPAELDWLPEVSRANSLFRR